MAGEISPSGILLRSGEGRVQAEAENRALTHTLEQMFREEAVPPVVEKNEWVEIEAWPKFVQDFEGDFTVECYVAMFLMIRNHLDRVLEAVGTTGMRYNEE